MLINPNILNRVDNRRGQRPRARGKPGIEVHWGVIVHPRAPMHVEIDIRVTEDLHGVITETEGVVQEVTLRGGMGTEGR